MRKPAIAVIGSGRAARAIVALAEFHGFTRVRVVARSHARAQAAAKARARRRAPARKGIHAVRTFGEAIRGAEFVVVAVSDQAIADVARRLATEVPSGWRNRTVLHLSGALGPEPLEPLAQLGARVGALHPLTLFRTKPTTLLGAGFRTDGSPEFRAQAREFAHMLGLLFGGELRPRSTLDNPGRARYHAAAAMVANDVVALLDDAVRVLLSLGIPRRRAEEGLANLVSDAALAVSEDGPRRGLTGPVVRGDVDTVRRHLEALREVDPEIAEIHRRLSLRLVRIALDAKRITAARAAALRRVLGGPPGRRGV